MVLQFGNAVSVQVLEDRQGVRLVGSASQSAVQPKTLQCPQGSLGATEIRTPVKRGVKQRSVAQTAFLEVIPQGDSDPCLFGFMQHAVVLESDDLTDFESCIADY